MTVWVKPSTSRLISREAQSSRRQASVYRHKPSKPFTGHLPKVKISSDDGSLARRRQLDLSVPTPPSQAMASMMERMDFISLVLPPQRLTGLAWWFAIQEDKLLVQQDSAKTIPILKDFAELALPVLRQHYLGRLGGLHCFTVEVPKGANPPAGMRFEGLRQIYGQMDETAYSVAGRALQIIDWDRTHLFCGRCGSETRTHLTERAKECPQCGLLHYPRLAPAIIVLIQRGPEVLLARARRFETPMYSTLAGFVEPGETLEEAVVREVKEESGITVKEIRYFGSQPWPFPHSLMIGFTANYSSGEITVSDGENVDVRWFTADSLPQLPGKLSIARKLIDWFVEEQAKSTLALTEKPSHT
ncbi:MAG: NAD(+) diphosphatase [Candidatus Bathyarchaeia archaeon]